MNVLGQPGTVVVVGGTSEIARAVLTRLLLSRPCDVILAGRPGPRLDRAVRSVRVFGAHVQTVPVDAEDVDHLVRSLRSALAGREVDVAIVAHGVLPEQGTVERDPLAVARLVTINTTAAVAAGALLADHMRRQGHGVIVAMSSVAAVRPRASNYVYGATKAGLDAYFAGLGERLRGTGVHVVVARPGFVRTRMTASLAPAPLAVGPDRVARAVLAGLDRDVVWVPAVLGPLMIALRLAPRALWGRLDRGASQHPLHGPHARRPRRPATSTGEPR